MVVLYRFAFVFLLSSLSFFSVHSKSSAKNVSPSDCNPSALNSRSSVRNINEYVCKYIQAYISNNQDQQKLVYVNSSLTSTKEGKFFIGLSNLFQPSGWNILAVYTFYFRLKGESHSQPEKFNVEVQILETKKYALYVTDKTRWTTYQTIPIAYIETGSEAGWAVFKRFKKKVNDQWESIDLPLDHLV